MAGAGCTTHSQQRSTARRVDIHIGTLSKAFGALGGFVATSAVIKALVLNKVSNQPSFTPKRLDLLFYYGVNLFVLLLFGPSFLGRTPLGLSHSVSY
eukprot:1146510-Pelagomonas_calceolata.AAC.7